MNQLESKWLQQIHQFDVRAFLAVSRSHWRKQLVRTARVVSRTADGWPYLLIPVLLYPVDPALCKLLAWMLCFAFLLERSIYFAMKKGFKRRRPPQAIPGYCSVITASDEFSFPSGHTSGAFLVSTLLLLTLGSVAWPLYLWACLVGMSRVVLGVHFPTDIVAGALIGTTTACLVAAGYL